MEIKGNRKNRKPRLDGTLTKRSLLIAALERASQKKTIIYSGAINDQFLKRSSQILGALTNNDQMTTRHIRIGQVFQSFGSVKSFLNSLMMLVFTRELPQHPDLEDGSQDITNIVGDFGGIKNVTNPSALSEDIEKAADDPAYTFGWYELISQSFNDEEMHELLANVDSERSQEIKKQLLQKWQSREDLVMSNKSMNELSEMLQLIIEGATLQAYKSEALNKQFDSRIVEKLSTFVLGHYFLADNQESKES